MPLSLRSRLLAAISTVAVVASGLAIGPVPAGAAPLADAGGPYIIAEGDELVLDGSGSTGTTSWAWDLNGDGGFDDAVGPNPSVPWSTLIDLGIGDDGTYPIVLRSGDGVSTNDDVLVTGLVIGNTPPSITVESATFAPAGRPFDVTVSVEDPGADNVSAWTINWGDGTIQFEVGATGPTAHLYPTAGQFDITVSVTDDDGTWTDADLVVPSFDSNRHLGRYDGADGSFVADLTGSEAVGNLIDAEPGPDGLVYVASYSNGKIARYDPAGNAFVDFFATTGMVGPDGLAFGPDGNLYVADWDADKVVRFDGRTGVLLGDFVPAGSNGLSSPSGITFGPDGHLYVTSGAGNTEVQRYDGATGASLGAFVSVPGTSSAEDLEFGPDGNLYVAFLTSDNVARFDGASGASLGDLVPAGSAGLNQAQGLTFGPDGHLYVSSASNDTIKKYDGSTGAPMGDFVTSGSGDLRGPGHLTFLPDKTVVAVDPSTVNSTGDTVDAAPGNGVCDTAGTNAQGAPECTLRAAIQEAESTAGPGVIHFAIPTNDLGHSAGVWTIDPGSELSYPSEPVVIDGSTQPGYGGTPVIRLDGSGLSGGEDGLHFLAGADGSRVEAMAVTGYPDIGVIVNADDVQVVDNHIGVMPDGLTPAGNADEGLVISTDATDTTVDGNLIGDSGAAGIAINDAATGTVITGNRLGTDATGTVDLGNGQGVWADTTGWARIGGTDPSDANIVAFNRWDGIELRNIGAGFAIVGNSIHSQGLLGIDVVDAGDLANGVTPNDPGDGDGGVNELLNQPDITSASEYAGTTTVMFDLDVPSGSYRVEFFSNPSGADPSGHGEGERFESATIVSAGSSLTYRFAGSAGDVITATATRYLGAGSYGPTSEFSATAAVAPATASVNSTRDAGDTIPGDGVCDTGSTNSATAPECTLRAAIQEANASPVLSGIHFAMPATEPGHSGGVWTITPTSELPALGDTVIIDARTQPGFSGTPVVELNGASAGAGSDGLSVSADAIEIRGLAVNRFGRDGIEVDSSAANTIIAGNHIGVDPTGMIDRGNLNRGIDIQAGSGPTTIGGPLPVDRNLISGNNSDGVIIWNSDDNVVVGNLIGTNIVGTAPLANGSDGIKLGGGAEGNTIGVPGNGNVMSGNGNDGVEIDDPSPGNIIQSNRIGLGADGATVVANGRHGVVLYNGVSATRIGGTGPGEGNVVSGNTQEGVHINANLNAATVNNTVEGNLIGTDATGMFDRGNGTNGVSIGTTSGLNTIGGSTNGSGNVISGNNGEGLHLEWANGSVVAGNVVGLASDELTPLGNGTVGLRIEFGGPITVGGSNPGARNVISSNGGIGIQNSAGDVRITGNYVGTDGTGLLDRGNVGIGIHLSGQRPVIGGPGSGEGNVIAGNGGDGIQISVASVIDGRIQGNLIGVGSDATTPLGNGLRGISVFNASNVLIGGSATGEGNVIANHPSRGVLTNASATRITLLRNSIHGNLDIGFDLGIDGVNANDPGDVDSGSNDLLNHPEITAATESGGVVTVTGTFDVPAGSYRFEFFKNPGGADPTGFGEGQEFVASSTLSHPGGGSRPFGAAFPGSVGDIVTITLTQESAGPIHGSTSEFSAAFTVVDDTGGTASDSSGRRTHLVAIGGLDLTSPGSGVVAAGLDLGGGTERLVGPATDIVSDELTLSAWVRLDAAGTDPRIVAKAASDGAAIYELLIDDATGEAVARFAIGGSTVEVRGGVIAPGTWTNVAGVWDGDLVRLYLDGVEVDNAAATGPLATDLAVPLTVGNLGAGDRGFDGSIDHVRISHVARSSDWMATAHSNVAAPSSFVSIGGIQTSSPQPWAVSATAGRSGTRALRAPATSTGADAWATAAGIDEPGIEFEAWWYLSDPSSIDVASGTRTGSTPVGQHETALTASGLDLATIDGTTRTQHATTPATMAPSTWTRVVIRTDETGVGSVWIDGVQLLGQTPMGGGTSSGSVGLRVGRLPPTASWYIDDVRLRRLVSDEPITSLGPIDRN